MLVSLFLLFLLALVCLGLAIIWAKSEGGGPKKRAGVTFLVIVSAVVAMATVAIVSLSILPNGLDCIYEPCIRYHEVSFANQTDEQLHVQVYDARGSRYLIFAGQTVNIDVSLYDSRGDDRFDDHDDPIQVRFYDDQGCDVLTIHTSLREIQDGYDSKIVVRPADLLLADNRVDCRRE